MRIRMTPTNMVILGAVFLPAGVLMIATGTITFVSVCFCWIGVFGLLGGIIRRNKGGKDIVPEEVAPQEDPGEALQREWRERFGGKP